MKKLYPFVWLLLPFSLKSQCTFTTFPYLESFQGITANGQLPACWASFGGGVTSIFNLAGNNDVAAFSATTAGTNYLFTPGLGLQAGITYSVAAWYLTDSPGSANWTQLEIALVPAQAIAGASVIVSAMPQTPAAWKDLSGTFTVPSQGTYYLYVAATSTASSPSTLMYLDDLSVEIPCVGANVPTLGVSPSSLTMCAGDTSASNTFTLSGADLYSWNGGLINGNTLVPVFLPPGPTQMVITGSSTLTGCASSVSPLVNVNPVPQVFALSTTGNIYCPTLPIPTILQAIGAPTFSWVGHGAGSSLTVSPQISTSYTVIGTNSSGCSSSAYISINVVQPPQVTIVSATDRVCFGDSVVLQAIGALSYTWSGASTGNTISVKPQGQSTYTVTGTDINNCTNKAVKTISVDPLPQITSQSSRDTICREEVALVTAGGAQSYSFLSGTSLSIINPVPVSGTTATVLISGMDANGCIGQLVYTQGVRLCTALEEREALSSHLVWPNPASEHLYISGELNETLQLFDYSGRLLAEFSPAREISISSIPQGLYLLRSKDGAFVTRITISR